MSRTQLFTIAGAAILLLLLYFVFDTKAPEQRQVEASRVLAAGSMNVDVLLRTAHEQLEPAQLATISALEEQLQEAIDDSSRVVFLEQLSGKWYEYGQTSVAGHYAQQIAELLNTETAWSIAGTTYAICVQQSTEDRQRSFCSEQAVRAFENAISLNPDNVTNRLNLALTYTDDPPENNPMKGVLMLRDLQQEYPQNVEVLVSLGRLAIKTGQYQRAVQRLQQALAIDASYRRALCLMASAYEGLGNRALSESYAEKCAQAQ